MTIKTFTRFTIFLWPSKSRFKRGQQKEPLYNSYYYLYSKFHSSYSGILAISLFSLNTLQELIRIAKKHKFKNNYILTKEDLLAQIHLLGEDINLYCY